jgi:hypothetical protein
MGFGELSTTHRMGSNMGFDETNKTAKTLTNQQHFRLHGTKKAVPDCESVTA